MWFNSNIAEAELATEKIAKRQSNAIILAGIAIAVLFKQVVGPYLIFKSEPPLFRLLVSNVLMWITMALLYLYAVKVEGREFFIWKDKPRTFWFYIAAIAVLFVVGNCCLFISTIPQRLGYHDNYTMLRYWRTVLKGDMPMLVFTCITAGVTEELQMRAYILPRLYLLLKPPYLPIVVSALIFSFLHLGYGSLGECIFTFGFGVVCASFYRKYQNIQILIIFHFLYDLIAFLS
jgi:membrane protease YdiL (CAAX protease family)